MRTIQILFAVLAIIGCPGNMKSQDLQQLFIDSANVDYATATFKSTHVINGQSIENPAKGNLVLLISHRFGQINRGGYEMWGLDNASARYGFDYGLTSAICLGIGRSTYLKTFDGYAKIKLLKQSSGARIMPVSVSLFESASLHSIDRPDAGFEYTLTRRMAYVHQLLIARKFSSSLSVQLSPTLVHRNLVATSTDPNNVFSIGLGARMKISKRTSVNGEWFILTKALNGATHALSFGFDFETGGHVFQLFLTNAQAPFEKSFITETTGLWDKGGIFFGFNISRTFVLHH